MTNLKKVLYDELKSVNYSKDNAIYRSNRFDKGWVCTCGIINFDKDDCPCGLKYDYALKLFDEKYLEDRLSFFEEKN